MSLVAVHYHNGGAYLIAVLQNRHIDKRHTADLVPAAVGVEGTGVIAALGLVVSVVVLDKIRRIFRQRVDHGYGNIKTANHCFKTGIIASDTEPIFTKNMLVYDGKYFLIGEGHKEFRANKDKDDEYYLLTIAAIAMELKDNNLYEADVIIAAGLPLTWTGTQKAQFAAYLKQNKSVAFTYNGIDYNVDISGVMIYPQGYAAIAPFAVSMKGLSMVADIGNGTMNTLYLANGRPQSGKMYTEKFGAY